MTREYYIQHHLGSKWLPEKFQTLQKITLTDKQVMELSEEHDVMITSSNSGLADRRLVLDQLGGRFRQR